MKTITQYLFLFIFFASCNVLNSYDEEVKTNLELESSKISNIQDVEGTFTIINGTDSSKTYSFNSGCQSAFKVLKEGYEVFNSSENIGCTGALTSFTLQKRESKVIEMYRYFDIELEPGKYMFKVYLIGYENEVNASKEFVVVN